MNQPSSRLQLAQPLLLQNSRTLQTRSSLLSPKSGTVSVSGDLTVSGNLTISGNTTTLNTETLAVEDNVILLNSSVTGAPSLNAGLEVERGDQTNVEFRWNEGNDKWEFSNDGTTYVNVASTTDVSNHESDTTNIHGIANTANLATLTDLSGHTSATTSVHGISNTAELVTLAGSQTLTNKTLTSPTITGVSPVITLAGDLTGNVTLTDLGSATLTATVAPNSVALGTDTTGNYVADFTAGTGITITHTPGEGSTATIAVSSNTYQPVDAELTALAGVTAAADALPYFTSSSAAATTTLTSFARTLLDDANAAVAATTLGLGTGNSPTFTDLTLTGALTVNGLTTIAELADVTADATITSNVLTVDFTSTNTAFIASAPSANFTLNVTNLPTTDNRMMTVTVVVTQGSTGYIPNAVQIGGAGQTIKWSGGSAPTATNGAGKLDIFSFSFMRRSGAWTVFGATSLNY